MTGNDVAVIVATLLALFSMIISKSKYSPFFSISALLILINPTLEKMNLEVAMIFLLLLVAFEIVCFSQKAWDFHQFKKPKASRHKLFWISICLTIGVTIVVMASFSLNNFSLEKIQIQDGMIKVLLPITLSMYGLLKNKKRKSV